ncbi:MAG TPA: class I SAM-dependent methyltransferase [Chloroflexota bacterium]|nr:class I SAM-dependent methyltransferase [Chloroflexota bacterium]
MTTPELDMAKVEEFAGRLMGAFNGAGQVVLISIGHQTGLFDTLATLPPATSAQIAEATGLNERYVREWLDGMVVSRIVEYTPSSRTYALPPTHAALLTRAAGNHNLAGFAPMIPQFSTVESAVIESFRNGGGVPYSAYPHFGELMAELSAPVVDATLVQSTLPLVPGLVDRLQTGIDVADIGCGAGHAVNTMAKAFPSSRCTGFDFSEESIAMARAEAAQLGLTNARFEVQDVAALDLENAFDLITVFDAIHDQARPKTVLEAIHRALRPGGTYLMADIAASSNVEENVDHPLGPMFYAISLSHCMTVSLALGGEGLGNMWGEQKALEYLAEAGFKDVSVKRVEGDIINNFYICSK